MSYTKNILYNTLAQYLGKAIGLLATIVVTSILTRSLGVEGYGRYVYIYSLVLLINAFADWGSTFIATREAAQKPAAASSIYSTTLIIRLSISFIFQLLLLTAGLIIPSLNAYFFPLLTASFLLPLLSLKTSLQVVFQSRFQLWRLSLIDTLGSVLFMVFVLLFAQLTHFSTTIFIYLSLSALVGTLVGIFLSLPLFTFKPQLDLNFARRLLLQSLSMGALLTVYSLYNRLDIFVLRAYQGEAAVGLYGFAYKIYENILMAAGFLANATFPLLSARALDKVLFRQAFEKYFAVLLVLGLLAAAGLMLTAPFIVNLLAGSAFTPAVFPLRLLSLSLIGAFLGHATGYSLIALNQQIAGLKIISLALLLNLSLNLVFIPRFSYPAAALITLITEAFAFLAGLVVIARHLHGLNLLSGFRALTPKELLQSLHQK